MNQVDSEFRWPLRVYIEDTDAGGIVFYVNYLKYMERARTEFMRAYGYGKAAIFSRELMFVVRSLNVDYRAPAQLDDALIATARIVEHRATQLTFEQRILRSIEGERMNAVNTVSEPEIVCAARVNIVCVDVQTLRPKRIPEELFATLGLVLA